MPKNNNLSNLISPNPTYLFMMLPAPLAGPVRNSAGIRGHRIASSESPTSPANASLGDAGGRLTFTDLSALGITF